LQADDWRTPALGLFAWPLQSRNIPNIEFHIINYLPGRLPGNAQHKDSPEQFRSLRVCRRAFFVESRVTAA
ncbi:MAG: hypothetical protein LBI68_07210, partial [Azoarcus sp.]|nr:hypothetical protein [Azoarcus sp.]